MNVLYVSWKVSSSVPASLWVLKYRGWVWVTFLSFQCPAHGLLDSYGQGGQITDNSCPVTASKPLLNFTGIQAGLWSVLLSTGGGVGLRAWLRLNTVQFLSIPCYFMPWMVAPMSWNVPVSAFPWSTGKVSGSIADPPRAGFCWHRAPHFVYLPASLTLSRTQIPWRLGLWLSHLWSSSFQPGTWWGLKKGVRWLKESCLCSRLAETGYCEL